MLAWLTYLILFVLRVTGQGYGGYGTPQTYCFNRQTNTGLNCAVPYATKSYDTERSCASECLSQANCKILNIETSAMQYLATSMKIQVAVYHQQSGSCSIYQQAPFNLNRGRRKRATYGGNCGYRGPQTYTTSGSSYYQWNGKCPRQRTTYRPPRTTYRPPVTPFPPPNSPQTTIRLRPTTTSPLITTTTVPLPARVVCPTGESPRYLKIVDYQLVGNNDVTFQASTQSQCLDACSDNRTPDGQVTPCLSFEYDTVTRTCTLSIEAAEPTGTGLLAPSPGSVYFEKMCLPQQLVRGCDATFDQRPQTVLVGHAQGVTTERTSTDCIKTCLDSERVVNFRCLSGQFYYEVDSFNCVLNSETKETKPDLLTKVDNEQVSYFDFKCAQARTFSNPLLTDGRGNRTAESLINLLDPEWSPWSCNKKLMRKHRFRNCPNFNPSNCEREEAFCN